ncbi:hypothetical protein M7I_3589 [Glarea lozoyensis 74030]|uniref:Uncharacterized protein n=1 Tax=Glarea lozoyensis (strain ATCC 74030 / MF5533) TaxID=1104152 RepID=H0ELW6_GLAL7|nr:hypothetical protein M7I_3589 [Glarea lozoyensis 74030]
MFCCILNIVYSRKKDPPRAKSTIDFQRYAPKIFEQFPSQLVNDMAQEKRLAEMVEEDKAEIESWKAAATKRLKMVT